jgi:hypothetical protein
VGVPAGHFFVEECPELVAKHLRSFLSQGSLAA